METKHLSQIQQFYEGKIVFVTGGTGFLGKVLLEKLLRCCSEIERIYVMIREKRGKTVDQRFDQLFDSELFDSLRKENPNFQKKVSVVYGDLQSPALGIKTEDLEKLKKDVNIIIHSAARVKWDDALRLHAEAHIVATSTLIELAKEFENLEAFVYVSSILAHRDPDFTVHERVGKKDVTPKQLLDALAWMNDEAVDKLCKILMKNEVMVYTLVKALTENVIEEFHKCNKRMPIAIVRSAYILPVYQDPYPGFCDSLQGVQAIGVAMAKGFLRVMSGHWPNKALCIPADMLANSIIASAWYTASVKPEEVLVVNGVLEQEKRPQIKDLACTFCKKVYTYPMVSMYRYPSLTFHRSEFLYKLHIFADHYIPAMLIDSLLHLSTGKTVMVRLYKKMDLVLSTIRKISLANWNVKMANYRMIQDKLSFEDSQLFFMDANIDWEQYVENMYIAGRKFILKEDLSNITYARRKAKIWFFVTTLLKWMTVYYLLRRTTSRL